MTASHQDPEILKKIENFCSYQERCKKEVIDKLFKLTTDQSEIDNIINYLVNRNFIDEQRFASSFTRGKFRIKKWGKIKITLELKKRGIDSNLISKAINQISDQDYISAFDDLSIKKFGLLSGSKDSRKRKFINFLSYRGWEYDFIIKKVNELF